VIQIFGANAVSYGEYFLMASLVQKKSSHMGSSELAYCQIEQFSACRQIYIDFLFLVLPCVKPNIPLYFCWNWYVQSAMWSSYTCLKSFEYFPCLNSCGKIMGYLMVVAHHICNVDFQLPPGFDRDTKVLIQNAPIVTVAF
jgi:hypothetical protein